MHETLSNNFIGFIDNFYQENGNLRISGWIVSKVKRDEVTYFLDIGHQIAFYNYNERQDVADHYKSLSQDYSQSGFDITIPTPANPEIHVYAMVSGVREDLFKLPLNVVKNLVEQPLISETTDIKIKLNTYPSFVCVDNFYENPDEVRALALQQNYEPDLRYHKGRRTNQKFLAQGLKQKFESLIGRKITNWNYEYNGVFQYCTAEDALVYHSDLQSYAGVIYLTPDAPPECGTSFFRSKEHPSVRSSHVSDANFNDIFKGGFYDKTKFELVDVVGNVYNRLVLFDSKLIHSATEYFGTDKFNSRLFHLFFFDIEE